MNRLLNIDYDFFEIEHARALRFLEAAQLRHEHYNLMLQKYRFKSGNIFHSKLLTWQEKRLAELENCPAITENEAYQKLLVRAELKQ